MAEYEVFQDQAGAWRWRLRADNGEIVGQSEGYTTKEDAKRGALDAINVSVRAKIVEVSDD